MRKGLLWALRCVLLSLVCTVMNVLYRSKQQQGPSWLSQQLSP